VIDDLLKPSPFLKSILRENIERSQFELREIVGFIRGLRHSKKNIPESWIGVLDDVSAYAKLLAEEPKEKIKIKISDSLNVRMPDKFSTSDKGDKS
jgi:hypothetical protein